MILDDMVVYSKHW